MYTEWYIDIYLQLNLTKYDCKCVLDLNTEYLANFLCHHLRQSSQTRAKLAAINPYILPSLSISTHVRRISSAYLTVCVVYFDCS